MNIKKITLYLTILIAGLFLTSKTTNIKAETTNNTYILNADSIDEDEAKTSTETITGVFPKGEYTIVITYNNDVKITDVGPLYVNYDMKQMTASQINTEGYTVTYKFKLEYPATKLSFFDIGIKKASNSSLYTDYAFTQAILTIPALDNTKPVIDGWVGVYYTNYDNPKPIEDIISKISAIDETDGSVTINITQNNYTNKEKTLGSHLVQLTASDKAGNTSSITIDIVVVDATKPTITGTNTYTSNMSSPITQESIKAQLKANDNYDTNLEIELLQDNFTDNEQKKGSFTISYITTDSSTNKSEIFMVTVTNKDDIKPIITGKNNFEVNSTGTITPEYIISELNALDNVDTNLTINLINDTYTINKTIVGTYTMNFIVIDNSENTSDTFIVNITVKDDIPPIFLISKDFFSVDDTITLTHKQILDILLATNNIEESHLLEYKIIEDNYTYNSTTEGTYNVKYELKMNNGQIVELHSNIDVIGNKNIKTNKSKSKNTIDYIKEFITNLFKTIIKYLCFGWIWDKKGIFTPNW